MVCSNTQEFCWSASPHTVVLEFSQLGYGSLDTVALERITVLLEDIVKTSSADVVVDLAHVAYFGAQLSDLFVIAQQQLRHGNRQLVLCSVPPLGLRLVQLLKLDKRIPCYPSQADALRDLQVPGVRSTVDHRRCAGLAPSGKPTS